MKKFLKSFLIILTALFFIDWFLGVLRFHIEAARTVLEAQNIPVGIIALRLEEHAESHYPMMHPYNNEFLIAFAFFAMVFLQALLYTIVFLLVKKLRNNEKVRTVLRHIPH